MPAQDRVLIQIATAANMTGIKDAQKGFLGMTSSLSAMIAGFGLLVVATKSAIQIAEEHEKAEQDLAQAVKTHNANIGQTKASQEPLTAAIAKYRDELARLRAMTIDYNAHNKHTAMSSLALHEQQVKVAASARALTAARLAANKVTTVTAISEKELQAQIEEFIKTNRRYISSQAEVINGYATLTRAGLSQAEVQKDMNRAIDLAALKHISLGDAVALVNAAEHGRLKGLVDLGITSKAYVDSSGNVVDANKNMASVMAELDAKTAHGRETTSRMVQATNSLSNDWQDLANNVGPPLLDLFAGVLRGADWIVGKLKQLGENKAWAKFISDAFGHWQDLVVGIAKAIGGIVGDIQWLINNAGKVLNALGSSRTGTSQMPRGATRGPIAGATGFEGTVSSPTLFLAGEAGSKEHVSITPGGRGGRTVNIIIQGGIFMDHGPTIDRMTLAVAQRLRMTNGI